MSLCITLDFFLRQRNTMLMQTHKRISQIWGNICTVMIFMRRRKWKWSVSFAWVFLLQESLRLRFPMGVSVVLRRYSVCEAIQTLGTQDNTLAQRNALSHNWLKWTSSCDNSNLIIFLPITCETLKQMPLILAFDKAFMMYVDNKCTGHWHYCSNFRMKLWISFVL